MKKMFELPFIELVEISCDDIIQTSGDGIFNGFGLDPDGTGNADQL